MSRDVRNGLLVSLPMSVAMIIASLVVARGRAEERPQRVFSQADLIAKVLTRLEQDYVERFDDEKSWELVYGGIKAMTKRLDPYSQFLAPEESRPFAEETHKNYVGVGFATDARAAPITIDYLFDGSPAERAGLLPGDRVVAIDGTAVDTLARDQAIERIKGEPGTTVRLTIERGGEGGHQKGFVEEMRVERARIPQQSVVGGELIEGGGGVGYVHVDGFGDETVKELDAAIEALLAAGMKALLLDLRSNNGGLLEVSRQFANRFLRAGAIVGIKYREPKEGVTHFADPAECRWPDLPLAILVNGDTASAAEIVAGALQDHHRALLVGERTYGKGVVQSIWNIPLDDRRGGERKATLKLTTAEYLTPSGRAIEKRVTRQQKVLGGLEPDFTLRLDEARGKELAERLRLLHVPPRWRARHLANRGLVMPPLRDRQVDAALAVLRGETPAQDF
jgi:carboxyl-terminal processing protease